MALYTKRTVTRTDEQTIRNQITYWQRVTNDELGEAIGPMLDKIRVQATSPEMRQVMALYTNGELGEAIGTMLDKIRDQATTPEMRQVLVEYLRTLCELAILRAEQGVLIPADDSDS